MIRNGAWVCRRQLWKLLGTLLAGASSMAAQASASGVVISQVYGGNGNTWASDYVELFNGGSAAVDITGWSVQYSSATGTGLFNGNGISVLGGVLQPGQYTLVKLATSAGGAVLPTPNLTGANTNVSATAGKLVLVNVSTGLACNGNSTPCSAAQLAQIVDLVGYGGANFAEGSPAPGMTATTALLRNGNGCADTGSNLADFSVGAPAPRTTASTPAPCAGSQPIVASCPAAVTTGVGFGTTVALGARDGDGIVSAASITSAPVAGLTLSGFMPSAGVGANAAATLNVAASVATGSYPVTLQFSNAEGQNASCTVNVSVVQPGPYTPIYSIQGSGPTAALTGTRTTRGIVTLVMNNGYFLQDESGDGDPATSDGIFVFTSTAPTVTAGQRVQVTGTVTEFDVSLGTANPVAEAHPLTEITAVTGTIELGTGSITPTVVTLPLASADDFERYEGMLVTLTGPLSVSQNFFQGRYGQVTISAGGRLMKPTNQFRPGTPEALALADANARSALLLDDGSSLQNPNPTPYIGSGNTLRAGDTLPSVTGVIDYGLATGNADGLSLYRIQPTVVPAIVRTNARTAAPPAVGGAVKVASFNVLNYFTTFSDGTNAAGATGQVCTQGGSTPAASLCRGADNLAEFQRQQAKIVQAMAAINADVFGLMEIQNNGDTAVQNLVSALNAAVGAGTYAVVPQPPSTGTDAIRVAMIFKPAALALSGAPMSDGNAIHNRPPFAQAFSAGGQKFSVVVNHFKSKGCTGAAGADLDQGDGQGCFNDRRKQQATALLAFVSSVQSAAADNDVILIGDFNAYGQEDPIDMLTAGGLVNQITRFEPGGYSYVFDGEAGYLDHALTTASLSVQVAGATHWHINADEPSIIDYNTEFKAPAAGCAATCPPDLYTATPYRSSDHDPVVVGLALGGTLLTQTITFAAPADRALNAGSFFAVASASSGLAVSFTGSTPAVCTVTQQGSVTLVGTGSCSITASQAGNGNYAAAAPVVRSFNITAAAAAQSISFGPLPDVSLGSGTVALSATASSGLPVVFGSLTPAVCSVSGSVLTLVSAGACTVAADQPGNASWLPAAQVVRTFAVSAATAGGGDADIPTLPEWGLLLLGAGLMARGLRRTRDVQPEERTT